MAHYFFEYNTTFYIQGGVKLLYVLAVGSLQFVESNQTMDC